MRGPMGIQNETSNGYTRKVLAQRISVKCKNNFLCNTVKLYVSFIKHNIITYIITYILFNLFEIFII